MLHVLGMHQLAAGQNEAAEESLRRATLACIPAGDLHAACAGTRRVVSATRLAMRRQR
ncbi:MAG: hypothetical protein R3F11_01650 [Verrucomicrobiales bacterium]